MKALVLLIPILFFPVTTVNYDREGYLTSQYLENGGCAYNNCPQWIIEDNVEETGGVLPPNRYQKDSKEYWRSFCTYSPESCK